MHDIVHSSGARMTGDRPLEEKIREALRAGELPTRAPSKLFGGPASGAPCAVCGVPTAPGEVELQLEFDGSAGGSPMIYRVHPRCFSMVTRELERLGLNGRAALD